MEKKRNREMKKQKDEVMENGETEKCKKNI